MTLFDMQFKRKFSLNFCKNLKLPLANMTFTSDFYDGDRGDLYPLLSEGGVPEEHIMAGVYAYRAKDNMRLERYFTQFFPYASYEMKIIDLTCAVGFGFTTPCASCEILIERTDWGFVAKHISKDGVEEIEISPNSDGNFIPIVSLRPGAFEFYLRREHGVQYIKTFNDANFNLSHKESDVNRSRVSIVFTSSAKICDVSSYMDSGLGMADMRSVRYENGEIILHEGKLFFTASIRRRWGTHQGVFSWVPGTAKFEMVGALFFDAGDGMLCDDVATSLIFNRQTNKWHLHVASFNHGHVVGSAIFDGDVRFGVNIVDIKLMEPMNDPTGPEDTLLLGKDGDEDPDLIYDEERGKWLFSICRHVADTRKYRYYFFESDYPDRDFVCVGEGIPGEETGGSIMRIDGTMYFICGNSRKLRSDYRVYKWGDFSEFQNIKFDFPDGGFRGWGTILPVRLGTRLRYFHLTFDRVRTSEYEWSYGNVYCFEGESKKI